MNILLTNDDGYDSIGIRLLKEKLSSYGQVIIVAPNRPMSAQSASLTFNKPLHLFKHEKDIFSCDGTPADCVSMGLLVLDMDFDLVVSGCNNGLNISYDIIYSGTVAAGLQALMLHKPAVAISTGTNNFAIVDKHFDEVFAFIKKHQLISDQYLLNINFPYDEQFNGVELGYLYYRNDKQYMQQESDGYYAYRHMDSDSEKYLHSDGYQISHGIVSIVPLGKTYFNENIYQNLLKKINQK